MALRIIFSVLLLSMCISLKSQRLNEYNSIGWYTTTGKITLTSKWSIHTEAQLRRAHYITEPQQNLIRNGISYQLNKQVTFRIGHAWVEVLPYGTYTIQRYGTPFGEHRAFQAAILNHTTGNIEFTHRYMLEQRWIATYLQPTSSEPDKWTFMNRVRYLCRIDVPLMAKDKPFAPFISTYNEILIGFGKNVQQNIFDQNRFACLLGVHVSKKIRVEAGYLSQVLQLGRLVNGRNAFQHNAGVILNTYWNL